MKEWFPDLEFSSSDFKYNEKKNISEVSSNYSQKIQDKKQNIEKKDKKIQKWVPLKIQDLEKNPDKIKAKEKKIPLDKQIASVQKSNQDMQKEYINSLFPSYAIKIADILRKWYWEKNLNSTKKIYIILHSLHKENAIQLFQYFSMLEKKQFIEIYKRNFNIYPAEIMQARNEFIHFITQLG